MVVFISYSSREYEEAYRLKTIIEGNGILCWMAPQSIPAGSDYSSEIPIAITKCDAFVLVLSAASQSSTWVPKELDYALSCNKAIIPFQIDESNLINSFNFRLSNVQRIEAFNRTSAAYHQLVDKLQTLKGIDDEIVNEIDEGCDSSKSKIVSFAEKQDTSRDEIVVNKQQNDSLRDKFSNMSSKQFMTFEPRNAQEQERNIGANKLAQDQLGDNSHAENSPPRASFNTMPKQVYIHAKEAVPDRTYREGPIQIQEEKAYWILTTVRNMCTDENNVAENVRLSMGIKQLASNETMVESTILCPNAEPNKVKQSIHFLCDKPFKLEYRPNCAWLYSEYYGLHSSRGMSLDDGIMTEKGTVLGFWNVDGRIPGGFNNTVTVAIEVKVIR